MLGSVASASPYQVRQQPAHEPPAVRANAILAETSGRPSTYDRLGQIEARLDDLARIDPEFASQVRAAIMASPQLTPVQKAQLTASEPGRTVNVDGSRTQRFAPGGMAWDAWIDSNRARNTPEFQALARLAGSTENAPIRDVMQQLNDRGITAAQFEAERAAAGPSGATLTVDLLQMALDLTGIVDPSPISDGSNAVISLGRSISSLFSGEWSAAGGHLVNGVISAVGIIPALGDLAKAGKIGKWAQTVSDAITMMGRSPELARTLEPALREIKVLVDRIPQSALDALPSGARESIERMKTQLDEVFGAGARVVSAPRLVAGAENIGQSVTIKGRQVTIGDAPSTTRAADGTPRAANAAGDEVNLRQPATYDNRTVNADGTVTYERAGMAVRYDADGFPLFNTQAEVFLPADKIVVASRSTHFAESNRILGRMDDAQLRGAGFSDADIAKLRSGETPDNFTWHHHQDVGRMQLVRTSEHDHFRGGHTGGWSLWGDAARFR
jgi:hypothetical protein